MKHQRLLQTNNQVLSHCTTSHPQEAWNSEHTLFLLKLTTFRPRTQKQAFYNCQAEQKNATDTKGEQPSSMPAVH